MGMTFEQFWDMDCSLVIAYREAYRIRIEQQNRMAWLQGMYIYEALCDVAPAIKAFSKSRPRKYSEKPYDFGQPQPARPKKKQNKGAAMMDALAVRFNAAFKERHAQDKEVGKDVGCSESGTENNG